MNPAGGPLAPASSGSPLPFRKEKPVLLEGEDEVGGPCHTPHDTGQSGRLWDSQRIPGEVGLWVGRRPPQKATFLEATAEPQKTALGARPREGQWPRGPGGCERGDGGLAPVWGSS